MLVAVRFMLDTNVASAIIRGPNSVLKKKLNSLNPSQLHVSAVTATELYYGVARRGNPSRLETVVEDFLRHVTVLPWSRHVAKVYGGVRANLERRGTPIGHVDTQIAAHALAEDCVLVTYDKSFQRVPDLHVEYWLSIRRSK